MSHSQETGKEIGVAYRQGLRDERERCLSIIQLSSESQPPPIREVLHKIAEQIEHG